MKFLVGIAKNSRKEDSYVMHIVDTSIYKDPLDFSSDWEEIDINELNECVNIRVNVNDFKDNKQDPKEYLTADFDINKLIGSNRNKNDFQITNVYYDEYNEPQLYRVVTESGYIYMQDVSELWYRHKQSIYGDKIEELPSFVKKEPLEKAYEWWKEKDNFAKNCKHEFLSGKFEPYENMPVKILYHFLTGVKGFKVGFHTITEINDERRGELVHEYFLFKGTANVKLTEIVPKEKDILDRYQGYNSYGKEQDPYPDKRKLAWKGGTMSFISTKKNYSGLELKYYPDSLGMDMRQRVFTTYDKLKTSGYISEDWKLNEFGDLFGMTNYNILPNELSLLSARLQSEKENTLYGHAMSATHGHFSTFNTDSWFKVLAIPFALQYYSKEFREAIKPIMDNYQDWYYRNLGKLIDNIGAKDAYETMQWAKETIKRVMSDISFVKNDGSIKKSDIKIVDEMDMLFSFKRNNYPLPNWLQIYGKETIDALGGVELLQKTIEVKGEEDAKDVICTLAERIEAEQREFNWKQITPYVKPEEFIINESLDKNINSIKI